MSKVKQYITNGLMWKDTMGRWCKQCPRCNREIVGKDGTSITKFNVSNSITKGTVCHSCVKIGKPTWASLHREEMSRKHRGNKHPFYGKKHTKEFRQKQSKRFKGRELSDRIKRNLSRSNTEAWKRPDVREKYNNALLRTKWLKVRTDIGQLELLKKWNGLGFNFLPNYQIKVGNDLFYIDGYDVERNVVLEFDSSYHDKYKQSNKDLVRQVKIIKMLNPKRFWRYNAKKHIFIECMTDSFNH